MLEIRMADIAEQDTFLESRTEVMTFVCPVCRKAMSEPHLLDVQSVIADRLYFVQGIWIVDSEVEFEREVHYYGEEGSGLGELHVTVIRPVSSTGGCTRFEILEMRLTGDSMRFCAERNRGSGR